MNRESPQAPTLPASAPKRPWWRLHRSTLVVAAFLAVLPLLANLPGQIISSPGAAVTLDDTYTIPDHIEHGWPLTYLHRKAAYAPDSLPPQSAYWRVWSGVQRFRITAVLVDLLVGFAVITSGTAAFEAWRRRRAHLAQLHISDLLALMTLVSLGCAWIAANAKQHRAEENALQAGGVKGSRWQPGGPSWLRQLCGGQHFRFLDRVTFVEVDRVASDSLRPLRSVRVLQLNVPQLDCLKQLQHVDVLILSCGGWPNGTDLAGLRAQPDLLALRLHDVSSVDSKTADAQMQYVALLKHLKALGLHRAAITNEGLAHLTSLTELRELDLSETEITGSGLAQLGRMTSLKSLSLGGIGLAPCDLAQLRGLKNLEELDVDWETIGAAGLVRLRLLPKLKTLNLQGMAFNDDDLVPLADLTGLEVLSLCDTKITDAGLAHIRKLKNLKTLHLSSCAITDAGFVELEGLTRLDNLFLFGTMTTESGLAHLEQALPNCHVLHELRPNARPVGMGMF